MEKSRNLPATSPVPRLTRHPGKEGTRAGKNMAITSLSQPRTKKGLWEFLGAAGFCHIWIPGISAMARPLYNHLGGPDHEPPVWTEEAETAFLEIKTALGQACQI